MVADHYLMVQRWRPMFKAHDNEVKKIAVWIRLPNLPVELYTEKFLWRLGSNLGTMLKIDMDTSVHSRSRFARICVEIDLSQQLTTNYTAMGEEHALEYEGLDSIYFRCGRYGHKMDGSHEPLASVQMPFVVQQASLPMETHSETLPMVIEETTTISNHLPTHVEKDKQENKENEIPTGFGPWMLVKKSVRKKSGKNWSLGEQHQNSGSRFNVLKDITVSGQVLRPQTHPQAKCTHTRNKGKLPQVALGGVQLSHQNRTPPKVLAK
ncbi:uncharacterized protein LOC130743900 [Lotus japonicus]|uniref:uncharacterized protein LOC130743900 n=1 Tax=Lotus japonicus TaxID=34305 RepID=UPI0025847F63|nr:uncharacterized protein LOC130743900 [Lotus japonicus]